MAEAGSGAVKQVVGCVVMMMTICIVVISVPRAEAAISCEQVLSSLSPCIGYVQGGGSLPPSCCDGVKSLNNAAKTTPDVQAACRCIKSLASGAGANPILLNSIPQKCGVNIPYKYSPSLDCSKVIR